MPSSTVHNLLEACRESGCPICRLEQKSVNRYIDNHFYEDVNSPGWRNALRASLGFCHEHAWLGVDQRLGDALGYSIIYQDLIGTLLKQLEPGNTARKVIDKLRDVFPPRRRCPVCEQRDHVAGTHLAALVKELSTPEMTRALTESDGLCLPHLQAALEHIRDEDMARQVLDLHRKKLEGLRHELSEFIRKNEYQAVKEGFGKEGDAWLRAIGMLTGRRKGK